MLDYSIGRSREREKEEWEYSHRESWFCDRVIVYDLQKKEEFLFKVDNWLGTQNGDGKVR